MRKPSLLAMLSGIAPYRHIYPPSDEKCAVLLQEPLTKDSHYAQSPLVEVLPAADSGFSGQFIADKINFEGGLTLLKGRVNGNLENCSGIFEGPSKCAIELVNTLHYEVQDGLLLFRGKRVLELGCGHGLPGVFACLKGASVVHFQNLNAEVLRCLTIPSVRANLGFAKSKHHHSHDRHDASEVAKKIGDQVELEVRYYAGNWGETERMLSVVRLEGRTRTCTSDDDELDGECEITKRKLQSGARACERGDPTRISEGGYDVILMSETVNALDSLPALYNLILKCLRPYGVVYFAGKKHSYGLGGGTRQFKRIIDAHGRLGARLVVDIAYSAFNSKEVWKLFYR